MFELILIGIGMAAAAAIQPGPLQAFLLSSVAQRGWKRTLPASFAPVISDGPIAILALFVLNRVPGVLSKILQGAGAVFLIYLGWKSFRQWKQQAADDPETGDSAPRTLFQAAMVNILNPNPYLAWSLVLGPAFLAAWHESPANAIAFVAAFYATMVTVMAGTILLLGTTRLFGPRGRRVLVLVSAVILTVLGLYQLVVCLFRTMAT
jgi:threonine/homoserine/homoserine lactone efflux protein